MRICATVAEYNPFHKGHAYHISKSSDCGEFDAKIAIISSNFVQRGEPACIDKFARARMAVACGMDLAVELPVVYSCASAGVFADAAVDIAAAVGACALAFGMEDTSAPAMRIARCLVEEPDEFKRAMHDALGSGGSFALARARGAEAVVPGAEKFLRGPNNGLAVCYMKRIISKGCAIEPLPVARGSSFASALAIRESLRAGDTSSARAQIPEQCLDIFDEELSGGHVVSAPWTLWPALKAMIVRAEDQELEDIAEMREGFHNRMRDAAMRSATFGELLSACTSRRYTDGTVRRFASSLMLGLRRDESRAFQAAGPQYIRPLAANERGRALLHELKRRSSLPLVSRPSAHFSPLASRMMTFEHRATELRELAAPSPRTRLEAMSRVMMV